MDGGSLARHDKRVLSAFDLLGRHENDLTSALGFTLARSGRLLSLVLSEVLPGVRADEVALRLETRGDQGRTDLEIDIGSHLVVIEAKRGWLLPHEVQWEKYAPLIDKRGAGILVSLSQASLAWASQVLPSSVQGVPVMHLPWSRVRSDLDTACAMARGRERWYLDEFRVYLERAVKVRDPADSWTYCVVVSNGRPGGGGRFTFRDIVLTEASYFHPYGWGKGWPKVPPNFLAFRWNGKVQKIHRVTTAEVIPNLQTIWPDIPPAENSTRPHLLYRLGPALPGTPIPSGGQYRASHLWVILDQLLVGPTLAEAYECSKRISR